MGLKWVRASDGAIFGVCKGVARALDLSVGIVRVLFILAVIFGGVGIGLYLLLAISLPREDKQEEAKKAILLGVCAEASRRANLEVGIVRFLTVCLTIMSCGATFVGYIVLYFVFQEKEAPSRYSDNNPASPSSKI